MSNKQRYLQIHKCKVKLGSVEKFKKNRVYIFLNKYGQLFKKINVYMYGIHMIPNLYVLKGHGNDFGKILFFTML